MGSGRGPGKESARDRAGENLWGGESESQNLGEPQER